MPAWCCRAVLGLLLAGPAVAAAAPPGYAVVPVEATRDGALTRQLEVAVCGGSCASWPSVSTRGALDVAKAAALGVRGALTGAVMRAGEARTLKLALYTGKPKAAATWSFPLDARGLLPPEALRQLQADLKVPAARPATAAAAAPPPERRPAAPPPLAPTPPPAVEAAAAPVVAQATRPAEPAATPRPAEGPRPPWLAAEVGLGLTGRSLTYQGAAAGSSPLLTFDVASIWSPRLRLEAFPAAGRAEPLLQGLGLLLDYGHSVGLQVQAPGAPAAQAAAFSRLAIGALWRLPPLTAWQLVLVPTLAYQRHVLVASPAIAGLPDAQLAGLSAGLSAELPVGGRFTVLAGLGWVRWSTAQDLVAGSPAFFPGGSAWALDLEAGVALALGHRLSLRALLERRAIRYALDPDPTLRYQASGASDALLGGRLMLRAEY